MPIAAGTRLGSYEILALIGAGGMGEVYRARDPRLGRDVAIKVLPAAFAADPDRLRRFEQEARAVGQLSHPNILVVHDSGSAAGAPYLVSELLEGDSLRTRLTRSRPAPAKALEIAVQIARGLQAAHEKGIVHRDLKPDNVFLTTDGRVKILDFGLAKLTGTMSAADASTAQHTEPGIVMGTAGYMAPEQVRGEEADPRADLFAFGAILYEMLTGARAFSGASAMDVMGAILRDDPPDVTDTAAGVRPALGRIVRRCLEKTRASRFQSAADLCFAIETLSPSGGSPAVRADLPPAPDRRSRRGRAGWIAAALLTIPLVFLAINYFQASPVSQPAMTLSVLPPDRQTFGELVVSPDGRSLAFTDSERRQLWIRPLDGAEPRPLPGTEGASNPFWAPDGRSLGFFANNHLETIEVDGGRPQLLADVQDNRGGTWTREGVIIYAPDLSTAPLYQVSTVTAGARPSPVTRLDDARGERTHRWPHALPDGRHFLYFARSTKVEFSGVYVGSVDGQASVQLPVTTSTNAVFAPPGLLLFVQSGALMAQPFDARRLTLTGEASPIVAQLGYTAGLNRGTFSASGNGVLVYSGSEARRPVWANRARNILDPIAPDDSYAHVWLSPDNTRAALERADPRTGADDIHVVDLTRGGIGISSRFTTDPGSDVKPVWISDQRIVWASNRSNTYDLYQKALSGAGEDELLLRSGANKYPTDISPDGRFLVFESVDKTTGLWALPLSGGKAAGPPFALLDSGFYEGQARFSADGRWIAYTTDKDGSREIYLLEAKAVLPPTGQPVVARRGVASSAIRISTNGGTQPMWRRDGKKTELFYMAPDRRLMAVAFGAGAVERAGAPEEVLVTHVGDVSGAFQTYAVSADGQRFLVLNRVADTPAATIVLDWTSLLTRPIK